MEVLEGVSDMYFLDIKDSVLCLINMSFLILFLIIFLF